MNHIVLDNIVFSLQHSGGISVVWENVITSLQRSNLDYICLEYPGLDGNIVRQKMKPFEVMVKKPLSMKVERYVNMHIASNKPFIFHSSYYRTCSNPKAINVTTVHDFTYELYRSGISKYLHCWQKYRAICNSEVVVCISENTKRDLLKFLPDVNPDKVRVIYNGVSEVFKPLEVKTYTDLGPYAVFIGWRVGYKNFKLTVDALKDTGVKLAIVGAPLTETEKAYLDESLGKDGYFSFVRISDEELNQLYNSAYCLLYPSEYEGFGIPVLEAQRAGCPVIAYNGSSIPEVIGDTPLLLNELTVKEVKSKLYILKDKYTRETIVRAGLDNSMRFSWRKMGDEYVKLYKELLSPQSITRKQ